MKKYAGRFAWARYLWCNKPLLKLILGLDVNTLKIEIFIHAFGGNSLCCHSALDGGGAPARQAWLWSIIMLSGSPGSVALFPYAFRDWFLQVFLSGYSFLEFHRGC
jgi:hypothetical protein